MMRKYVLLFFLLLSAIQLLQANDRNEREKGKYSLAYIQERYTCRKEMIPMRDGVKLFTVIYEPKDQQTKHPILFHRTPYGSIHTPNGDNIIEIDRAAWASYIEHNYIIVFQDIRGKNYSEGEFIDIRPFNPNKKKKQIDEASDAYDSIEWLIHHTQNNNGNVGMLGISFPGYYTTCASLCGHPALKAVSPQAPVTDWFRGDDAHHNGALFLLDIVNFLPFYQYIMTEKVQKEITPVQTLKMYKFSHTDTYYDYLKIGAVKNFSKLLGDSITFWNEMIQHPDYDDWWDEHLITRQITNKKLPAVLIIGGLFDAEDCYGTFATYKAYKEQSPLTDLYIVDGPWDHGAWPRNQGNFFNDIYFGPGGSTSYYMEHVEYPFFAYYLEEKGEKPQHKARMFDTGTLQWNNYDEGWPCISREQATPYYLHANGELSTMKPTAEKAIVSYVSDPSKPVPFSAKPVKQRTIEYLLEDQRNMSYRPDVISFQTESLKEPIRLAGEIEADLQVDLSTTDADFVVKIIDVFPDDFKYEEVLYKDPDAPKVRPLMAGYQMLVRGEIMRGKYRESFRAPKPFEPGKVTKVAFNIPDISHTFLPGHKLMIQIQSSWFPLADRNPQKFCNIYTCEDSDFQPCTIHIHCEADAASYIKLPVVR